MTVLPSQSDSIRQSCVVKLHCKTFEADIRPEAVTSVFAGRLDPSILGGNNAECPAGRFSVWV